MAPLKYNAIFVLSPALYVSRADRHNIKPNIDSMNFRPTLTLGSIIARAAFVAEKNDFTNHLIDRLLLLAIGEKYSHASRVLQSLTEEGIASKLRTQLECELSGIELVSHNENVNIRSDFFAKIFDRLVSVLVVGEPNNTGHILLLAAADPTTISGEFLRRQHIDYKRLLAAMGTLSVDEDRYLDLSLQ